MIACLVLMPRVALSKQAFHVCKPSPRKLPMTSNLQSIQQQCSVWTPNNRYSLYTKEKDIWHVFEGRLPALWWFLPHVQYVVTMPAAAVRRIFRLRLCFQRMGLLQASRARPSSGDKQGEHDISQHTALSSFVCSRNRGCGSMCTCLVKYFYLPSSCEMFWKVLVRRNPSGDRQISQLRSAFEAAILAMCRAQCDTLDIYMYVRVQAVNDSCNLDSAPAVWR